MVRAKRHAPIGGELSNRKPQTYRQKAENGLCFGAHGAVPFSGLFYYSGFRYDDFLGKIDCREQKLARESPRAGGHIFHLVHSFPDARQTAVIDNIGEDSVDSNGLTCSLPPVPTTAHLRYSTPVASAYRFGIKSRAPFLHQTVLYTLVIPRYTQVVQVRGID